MVCCGSPRERTAADPVVVGDANGADPVRARVTLAIGGLTAGQVAWFTGTLVGPLIAQSVLIPQL